MYECISADGLATTGGSRAPLEAALVAQGVAMRDALAADLQRLDHVAVSCVASRYAPLSAALAGVRSIRPDADAIAPAAADFLAREAPLHDRVWVIAPESDDLLATLAAAVGPARWVGCTPPAIRLAASKAATRRRLASAGIAVPAAWHPGEPEPETAEGTHWIVKPDDGAGSVDARLHADFARARDDLLARLARGVASTLERWIDGTPISLSLLCGGGRAELLSINRQRIVARAGAPVAYEGVDIRAMPVDSPAGRRLAGVAQRIAGAIPGLAGYVGVDLVWRTPAAPGDRNNHDAGGAVVIEINPRLTCAYVGLSAALGRNLAGEILLARHPEPVENALH